MNISIFFGNFEVVKNENFMKLYIFIIASILILSACSTVKESSKTKKEIQTENVDINTLPGLKSSLYEMEFNSKITAGISGNVQTVNAKIKIAGVDSIQMNLTGPFGIAIGKFYANKQEFQFYNIFENSTYIGKPDAQSLKRILNMDISFDDFIRIIRGEVLFPIDSYKFIKKLNDDNSLWLSKQDNFGDFVIAEQKYSSISTYQRKIKDDVLVADIQLRNFNKYDEFYLANDINCSFPSNNSSIKLEISELKINQKFDAPFKFPIAKSSTVIKIDE